VRHFPRPAPAPKNSVPVEHVEGGRQPPHFGMAGGVEVVGRAAALEAAQDKAPMGAGKRR